ncbi:hypothetical protein P691DRAFT_853849 [Macrolepiota fuliginosa MF-IS2]|uniref:Zn(2)-C6 fungal-type domain-containing protein n=1 Tax=Macrolepiota fuliginosa MF-IS2 TaxID=1400762 RepID=A0A9P5XHR3_9AGAR|nr:hypothetical protein P691DRAFT_853849 [Macrolepiota fuliginosa MF-IS2]
MTSRHSSTPSSSSSDSSRLPRGSACLNCKRRRVKCDGRRPICGPCSRFRGHELDDCEFYEGQPPRSQVLQEQIADLQHQVDQLQGVEDPARVHLNSPYTPVQISIPAAPPSLGGSFIGEDFKTLPAHKIQGLLQNFGSFSSDVGFFLDPERFMRAAMQPHNAGHASRPCASLLYAVCLWGSKSLPNHIRRSFEETMLSSALRFVTEDLAGSHPRRLLQVMQAEVLLSMFFLNNSQLVEGFYHANAAASLAVSTKSNLIRSASVMQKPSGDAVDEGEWIDGFWTVVTLSNYWVLVNENQTFTFYDSPQMLIDTPWPLNNYYQEKLVPASHKTLEKFLGGTHDDGYSLLALHAKASVLLKKAIELSQKSDPGAVSQYNITNRALEQMTLTLPRLDQQMAPQPRQRLAVTHMLTQAAIIKLHRPRAGSSNTSRQRCVQAARVIADISLRVPAANPLQLINPILGLVWYIAHDILKTEIRHLEGQGSGEDKRLTDAVNQFLICMDVNSSNSPLIG